MEIKKSNIIPKNENLILIAKKTSDFKSLNLSTIENQYLIKQIENDQKTILLNQFNRIIFVILPDFSKEEYLVMENARNLAFGLCSRINSLKIESVTIKDILEDKISKSILLAFAEGLILSNYQFLNHFTDRDKKKNSLNKISFQSKNVLLSDINELSIVTEAVCKARDLINEPVNYLNAEDLAKEFKLMGKKSGFSVKVYDKKKIEKLGMGGLLAVNQGSIDEPTFTIMEWKPENAKNSKPYILVGKGVVYDTGGLTLKPTPSSMDLMKSDMSGGAAVGATMQAIAKLNLPIHIIALVPATDNRPGGNAFAPGDIIKMYNKMTVEMLNSDAEGRMILADALSFADQFEPELIIDIATLTGAAHQAVGRECLIAMGNAKASYMNTLKDCGYKVFERIAEFPFWDDYADRLKSDIADMKNIGGKTAGAITAGKFLEKFTNSPYLHLDIAGSAFLESQDSYRGKGGVGVGVRLFVEFFKELSGK